MSDSDSEEEIFVVAAALASEEEEHQRQKRLWVHSINSSRTNEGEFHTLFPRLTEDNKKFFQYFRMSFEKFMELHSLLETSIAKKDTNFRKSISTQERLAVTLRFLGHAGTYRSVAFSYRMGESTVASIVHSTCKAIWDVLSPIVMPPPTRERWEEVEKGFNEKWNYPNCVGAVYGKHVTMEKPKHSGSTFYNYKKGFSVVLLALVDANYKFVTVDVGAYGKNSDGGIFKESGLGKNYYAGHLDLPPPKPLNNTRMVLPHVMVADEAFPLHVHIMRPYPGTQLGNVANKAYNYRHSRARRVVESAFGILAKKFRVYSQKLQVNPNHVDFIVLATTCLHNFLREDDENLWRPGELEEIEKFHGLQPLPRIGCNSALDTFEIRDGFSKYFTSREGKVSWQDEKISAGKINL